jgi:hypothetical protein
MSGREQVQHPLRVLGFEPMYRRVAQTNQWNSAAACIACIVKVPIDEVCHIAIQQFKEPANDRGPIPARLLPDLFAHYDWWIASRYREANSVNDLPDLALIRLSKMPNQFALFHRQKFEDGKLPVAYLINPALGIPEDQQFRLDVDAILPCKYLSICSMV